MLKKTIHSTKIKLPGYLFQILLNYNLWVYRFFQSIDAHDAEEYSSNFLYEIECD